MPTSYFYEKHDSENGETKTYRFSWDWIDRHRFGSRESGRVLPSRSTFSRKSLPSLCAVEKRSIVQICTSFASCFSAEKTGIYRRPEKSQFKKLPEHSLPQVRGRWMLRSGLSPASAFAKLLYHLRIIALRYSAKTIFLSAADQIECSLEKHLDTRKEKCKTVGPPIDTKKPPQLQVPPEKLILETNRRGGLFSCSKENCQDITERLHWASEMPGKSKGF